MSTESPNACLEVRALSIGYGPSGAGRAAADIDLRIDEGECVGVVGESGSGKSQTCLAIMGLLPRAAHVSGSVRFRGTEMLGADDAKMRAVRGRDVSMVFQDPMTSFTPHLRIGAQLEEVLRTHLQLPAPQARARAIEMLERVRIDDAARRMRQYPHELSGGMRQRVMLAMACLCRPSLLIADEPTTALDATVQAQVMALLRALRADLAMALLLVTHDFALLAGMADRVIVMYAGRIVESAAAGDLLSRAQHPYTRGLLACVPRWPGARLERLPTIAGQPPVAGAQRSGCAFAPRCPRAATRCGEERPALRSASPDRLVACHFPHD